MLTINKRILLDESEISWEFTRSPGPGGQNVNKLATTARLRFDPAHSASLSPLIRRRLLLLAGRSVTKDGILIIEAHRYRSQARNRQDARNRLADLLDRAATPPRHRRKTRPNVASQRQRLQRKRGRSRLKQMRRRVYPEDQ